MDSNTKEPIPYVAVKLGDNKGLYTNENGLFVLKPNEYSFLELSHIAYNTLKIGKGKVNDTLYMFPKINALEEVLIQKSNNPELVLKPEKKAHSYDSFPLMAKNELITLIIPDKKIVNSSIKEISFSFSKNNEKMDELEEYNKIDAIVRINIYKKAGDSVAEKIYSSLPLKISSFLKDEISLNLSEHHVELTQEGLCFGVEMIGYSKETDLVEVKSAFIRPGLTDKQNKFFSSRTFLKYTFDDTSKILSVNELLMRGMPGGKEIDRNLILGMTVVPQ